MKIKAIIIIFIFLSIFSCSMEKKLIHELNKYEKKQFLEPHKQRNIRILYYLNQNHQLLLKNKILCDTFIIIDFFDSSKRKRNNKFGFESYGTKYGICGDSGLIHTDTDTIKFVKYYNQKRNPIYGNEYDSIVKKIKYKVWSSAPEQSQIVQVVTIKGRKIKITGFNIDGNSKVVKKIDR